MDNIPSQELKERYLKIFSFLNPQQYAAATNEQDHLLINAAAGTGKTTTIASRILYLQLKFNAAPSEILAISFSRSARNAISEKLNNLCNEIGKGGLVPTYTFHGLAYRIVRFAVSIGESKLRSNFSIIDSDTFFQNHKINWSKKGCADLIPEIYKKAVDMVRQGHPDIGGICLSPSDLPGGINIFIDGDFGAKVLVSTNDIKIVWKEYEKYLKYNNAIDFPGLILEAIQILNHSKGVTKRRLMEGLKFIIVDEYQDTSRAQEQLLFEFLKYDIKLNVVGDNDQTIYTFNGSDITNILNFADRLMARGQTIVSNVDLFQNYRSTKNILDLANTIVSNGGKRKSKLLKPYSGKLQDSIQEYRELNEKVELVYAPKLDLAASYVANKVKQLINDEDVDPRDIAILVRKDSEFSPQGTKVLNALEAIGVATTKVKEVQGIKPEIKDYIEGVCQNNYHSEIDTLTREIQEGLYDEERRVPLEEVMKILYQAKLSGSQYAYDIIDFLYESSLEEDENKEDQGVQIRTIHSAKGLEFRIVFLLYLGDKSFPHGSRPNIDEERRLLYVGVTRAMEKLFIIGRNGIHSADFFGECCIEGTNYVNYSVDGGLKNVIVREETEHDKEITLALKQQIQAERERKERLRKMMEDF
jgi:DNA helicase II / ATP-dependent DNA helicase PcrA